MGLRTLYADRRFDLCPQRQPDSFVNQLTGLTGLARQEQAYSADQLALGLRRLEAVHQAVGSLAANPNATVDDLHKGLGDLVAGGILPADQAQRFAGQIEALRGQDAQALRRYLANHLNSLQDARTNYNSTYGIPDVQDLGDTMLTRTVSPVSGVRQMAVSRRPSPRRIRQTGSGLSGWSARTANTSSLTDRYGNARPAPIGGPQGGSGASAGATMAPRGFTPTGPSLGQAAVAEAGRGSTFATFRARPAQRESWRTLGTRSRTFRVSAPRAPARGRRAATASPHS